MERFKSPDIKKPDLTDLLTKALDTGQGKEFIDRITGVIIKVVAISLVVLLVFSLFKLNSWLSSDSERVKGNHG